MTGIAAEIWDNRSGPEGAVNTIRGLIHSLDLTKEGLGMEPTRVSVQGHTHPAYKGSPNRYQRAALSKYSAHKDQLLNPWCFVTTRCDEPLCMNLACMKVHQPHRILYPAGICTYCGDPAGTKDHLLPRTWTGEGARRNTVATVPACANCNGRISDSFAISVTARREVAQESLRKTYRNLLKGREWTEKEINECGHVLQVAVRKHLNKRNWVAARLDWPLDPDYDLRAFQRSGIEFPAELGLI